MTCQRRSACCAKLRNTARQRRFSGLEAEALLGEAAMLSASNEAERSSVLHQLRAAIGIASDIGAKPLLHRAETALNAMLADPQRIFAPLGARIACSRSGKAG